MTWQPIETAPSDYSSLLLYEENAEGEGMGVFVGYYNASLKRFLHVSGGEWEVSPKHWMPLPNPPTKAAAGVAA